MKKILVLISIFSISVTAIAQYRLDPSFGNNGIVRTFFPPPENYFYNDCEQVIPHPDGSFFILISVNQQVFVAHRFANGSIDLNYGDKGYSVPFTVSQPRAALSSDGKIIVAGTNLFYDSADFAAVRYNMNGTLDKSFGVQGKQTIDFNGRDILTDIVIQHDGKIVMVGSFSSGNGFAIARLNNDGMLDRSFSGDGKQTTVLGGPVGIYVLAQLVVVQEDGRIVVVGTSEGKVTAAAYLENGEPDHSFGEFGIETFNLLPHSDGYDFDQAKKVAILANDKIMMAGKTSGSGNLSAFVMHINSNGTLDSSFSSGGIEFISTDLFDGVHGMTVDEQQRLLIAGFGTIAHPYAMLMRFTADGKTDSSFSDDGIAQILIGNNPLLGFSIHIQDNGKILVDGSNYNGAGTDYSVMRFNSNGTIDYSLDNDGIISDQINTGYSYYNASVVQPDGKIICAGTARTMAYVSDFFVVRYNPDGSLDHTFAHNGYTSVRFEPGPFHSGLYFAEVHGIALQSDGKIILAGASFNETWNFAVARLNSDGSMDSSFSEDGKLKTDLFGADDYGYAVAIQSDGKIVVAGSSATVENSASLDFSIVRYNQDGSLDNSFSWDGKQTTEFFSAIDRASKVMIQPDGKIILVGTGHSMTRPYSTDPCFAIVRYLSNGYPDNSFGYDGAIRIDFESVTGIASDAVLLKDGSILVAGTTQELSLGKSHFAIAKLKPNGLLDSSFATYGKQIIPFASPWETCNAIALQSKNEILLGGQVSKTINRPNGDDIGMVRLFTNGEFDSSFSLQGNHILDLGSEEETINSISIYKDRIYAVGSTWYGGRVGFVIALKPDCALTATIPDAFAMPFGVDPNTVYKGYAPADDLNLTAKANGKPPFTYSWSTGANTKSIHVSPNNTTTYAVTVTDASGCAQQTSKTVNVVDVRCGHKGEKVLICQVQHGKGEKRKTICVDPWAATVLLWKGARLGSCPSEDLSTANFSLGIEEENSFRMVASPNPSYDQFALDIKLSEITPAELIVRDIQGRVMERMTIHSTSLVRIGSNYAPGMYMAELRQGENRLVIKLVRASR